jgi:hypothetical protein
VAKEGDPLTTRPCPLIYYYEQLLEDLKHIVTHMFEPVRRTIHTPIQNTSVSPPARKSRSAPTDSSSSVVASAGRNTRLTQKKAENKKVWAYGASTKGNTLLQYFGLDSTLIDGIAERSPYKWGLKTVGTNIPIYSEDEIRKQKPDYMLVLPWHFINEFVQREGDFLRDGGTFIVPCPKFELITYKK